jgi:hypothetical protein
MGGVHRVGAGAGGGIGVSVGVEVGRWVGVEVGNGMLTSVPAGKRVSMAVVQFLLAISSTPTPYSPARSVRVSRLVRVIRTQPAGGGHIGVSVGVTWVAGAVEVGGRVAV